MFFTSKRYTGDDNYGQLECWCNSLFTYETIKAPHHKSLFQDSGMAKGKWRQGKLIFCDRTMFVFHTGHLLVG